MILFDDDTELLYKVTAELTIDKSSGQYIVHIRETDSLDNMEHGARFILSGREIVHAKHNIFQVHIERLQQNLAISRLQRKPSDMQNSYLAPTDFRIPKGWTQEGR